MIAHLLVRDGLRLGQVLGQHRGALGRVGDEALPTPEVLPVKKLRKAGGTTFDRSQSGRGKRAQDEQDSTRSKDALTLCNLVHGFLPAMDFGLAGLEEAAVSACDRQEVSILSPGSSPTSTSKPWPMAWRSPRLARRKTRAQRRRPLGSGRVRVQGSKKSPLAR